MDFLQLPDSGLQVKGFPFETAAAADLKKKKPFLLHQLNQSISENSKAAICWIKVRTATYTGIRESMLHSNLKEGTLKNVEPIRDTVRGEGFGMLHLKCLSGGVHRLKSPSLPNI